LVPQWGRSLSVATAGLHTAGVLSRLDRQFAAPIQHIRDWRGPCGEIFSLKYAQVAGSWQRLGFANEAT